MIVLDTGQVLSLDERAAVCRDLDATLAARNTADLKETGIEVANPWQPA
jgi:hypothetical protein